MRSLRLVVAVLLGMAILAGCNLSSRIVEQRSIEERRMVFPSDPPIDGVFVAIRGSGDEIPVPSEDQSDESRPPNITARPIAPSAGGEIIDRPPPIFIEPGTGSDLPLPPLPEGIPPTSQPGD